MEIKHYLKTLRSRWLPACIVALTVLGAMAAVTFMQKPIYTASNRVFVQTQAGGSVVELQQGASFAKQQITSYAELARSPIVLNPVISRLGIEGSPADLAKKITTTVPPNTLMIVISASSSDPQRAADLANATAKSLSEQVASLESSGGQPRVTLTSVSPATVPSSPSSPRVLRNLAIGAVLGILAGIFTAWLLELIDNRVRGPEDITEGMGRSVIASIPASKDAKQHPLISAQHPQSLQAEAFRELRTNLQFVEIGRDSRTLLVTSSLAGEGKSSTSVNLSHVMAQCGSRVLLIDADLRRPSLHEYLSVDNGAGLTNVLIGDADWEDVVQPLGQQGVDLMASGPIPPNPSEILGSEEMNSLLRTLEANYDIVVVDTAPLLAVTDGAILSKLVGGTLLVSQSDRVRRPQLAAALEKLDAVNAHVLGVVLNRVKNSSRDRYRYYYASEDASTTEGTAKGSTRSARSTRVKPAAATAPSTSAAVRGRHRRHSSRSTPGARVWPSAASPAPSDKS